MLDSIIKISGGMYLGAWHSFCPSMTTGQPRYTVKSMILDVRLAIEIEESPGVIAHHLARGGGV